MTTFHFDIHGVGLEIGCDDARLAAAVSSRLRHWRAAPLAPAALRIDFVARHVRDSAPFPPLPDGPSRTVYDPPTGEVSYAEARDRMTIRYSGGVGATCDAGSGRSLITFDPEREADFWFASHPILTFCLVEMLRAQGYYALHAAALAKRGKGVLLAGASGAGKSTLTVALLRAGFDYLGDDTCFLAPASEGVRVLAFPDEMDVTDRSVGFFPELAFLRSHRQAPGSTKRQLLPEEIYPTTVVSECTPAAIIFPRIGECEASMLERIDAAEAMMELVPNVLLTDRARAQAHLDAISRIVADCPCYRLRTGQDFGAIPAIFGRLLSEPELSRRPARTGERT